MPSPTPVRVRLELMIHAMSTIEGRERLRMAWDGVPEDGGPFQQLWGILTGMALLGYVQPPSPRRCVCGRAIPLSA